MTKTPTTILTVKFGPKKFQVESLERAAEMWNNFRDAALAQGYAPDDVGGGVDVFQGSRKVARVRWNGTIQQLAQ